MKRNGIQYALLALVLLFSAKCSNNAYEKLAETTPEGYIPPVPQITTISSTTADGTYKVGDIIYITIDFSDPIHFSGTLTISLNTGQSADYYTGNDTYSLTFSYVVQEGDTTSLLATTGTDSMVISGGEAINRDYTYFNASLTMPTEGDSNSLTAGSSFLIDGVFPTLLAATPTSATTVMLQFSEEVEQTLAETIANYTITQTSDSSNLAVSTATLQADPTMVELVTAAQSGNFYEVATVNLADIAGNIIKNNGTDNLKTFEGQGVSYEDPFNDSTPAGQVFVYDDKVYIGPNSTHDAIFEIDYAGATTTSLTLDADGTTGAPEEPFKNYSSAYSGTIDGIDLFYAGCVGGTSYASYTGTACTGAGGTEMLFLGAYNSVGNYRSFWQTSDKSSSVATFTFAEGGSTVSTGGVTYRSTGFMVFKEWLYFVSAAEGGGGGRMARICVQSGTCTDGSAQGTIVNLSTEQLTRFGQQGALTNGAGTGELVGVNSMWEHDADGGGANPSQLYIANGGTYSGALSAARATESDGGILRSCTAYSTAASPVRAIGSGPDGSGVCGADDWEDITPDTDADWNTYMSIPYPLSSLNDWPHLQPASKITPAIQAIPYIRTASNSDLYILRNACSTTNVCTNGGGYCDIVTTHQVCNPGEEVPQIWMMDSASTWQLAAENGATGKSNMGDANNTHLTLLEVLSNTLVVGYDNATTGIEIWKADMSAIAAGTPLVDTDFTQVSADALGLTPVTDYTRIFSHAMYSDATGDYVVLTVGNGSNAMKVVRLQIN